MNKVKCLIVLFLISCQCVTAAPSSSGKLASITITDANGFSETICNRDRLTAYARVNFLSPQPYQKVVRVYQADRGRTIRSFVTSYYPNGQPKQYLQVVNGRACGSYQEWHPNGQPKLVGSLVGGSPDIDASAAQSYLFDGMAEAWDEDGALLARVPYAQGRLEGTAAYYYPNQQLKERVEYCKGMREGSTQTFYTSGGVKEEITFHQGLAEGDAKRYWESGEISYEEIYRQGCLATGVYYNRHGEKVSGVRDGRGTRALFTDDGTYSLVDYRDGKMMGVVREFDKEGVLLCKYRLVDGAKHGEEVRYFHPLELGEWGHKDAQPKISISWYQGEIHGVVKTWYPNSHLESSREMAHNRKDGISSAWYADGSLMLIEEYVESKLTKGEYYSKGSSTPISRVTAGAGMATLYDADGHLIHRVQYYDGVPVV